MLVWQIDESGQGVGDSSRSYEATHNGSSLWFWQDPESRSVVPLYSLPPKFWHELISEKACPAGTDIQDLLTDTGTSPPPGAPWALLRLSGLRDR